MCGPDQLVIVKNYIVKIITSLLKIYGTYIKFIGSRRSALDRLQCYPYPYLDIWKVGKGR